MARQFRTTSTAPVVNRFDEDVIPPPPDLNARILASRNPQQVAALRTARLKAAFRPVAPPTDAEVRLRAASADLVTDWLNEPAPPPPDLNARIRAAAARRDELATLNFAHPSDCSGCPACNLEHARSLANWRSDEPEPVFDAVEHERFSRPGRGVVPHAVDISGGVRKALDHEAPDPITNEEANRRIREARGRR